MAQEQVSSIIGELGVVPVIVLERAEDAVPLAGALKKGGLPCAEVTFRTDAAEESIRLMAEAYPDMLIGAGTVLSVDQAKRAVAAGAKFIVAPGFDPELVDWCLGKGVPIYPGCLSPSEITQAHKRGLRIVKFFPAGQFGGVSAMKALGAPFPQMKFMPTGGVNTGNLGEYLACNKVAACGGTWLAKANVVASGDFEKIEHLTQEAVAIVKEARS